MADINPAEVSAILREQLSGFRTEAELQEIGTVLQVGDGIARVYGLNGVQYGELIEFDGGLQGIALNLEEDNVGAVLLGRSSLVKEGDTVKRLGRIASVKIGEGMVVIPFKLSENLCSLNLRQYRLKFKYVKCLKIKVSLLITLLL